MSLDPHDIVFRTRALAQTHPFTSRGQAYLNQTIARERREQPAEAMADWANHAITVGYCLRRVEEEDNSRDTSWEAASKSDRDITALDERSSELADLIRTDHGEPLFLWPEPLIIEAFDRIIFGEVERRISAYEEKLDEPTFQELESYIGWWTLKGYCLRVAEQLVTADDKSNGPPRKL